MMDTILTTVSSASTSPETERSMLTRASFSIYPTGVSEHGVEDCKAAATGETPERLLHLKEGLLPALSSNRSITLMGVGIYLASKGCIRKQSGDG